MTKKITTAAVFAAIGIILPVVTHQTGGQAIGQMLLPLHLMALVAGFLLGVNFGIAVAAISVLGSFLIASMPPPALLPYLLFQTVILGLTAGLLKKFSRGKEWRVYVALLIAQICGWFLPAFLFSASVQWEMMISKGFIGIILQMVVVPIIVLALRGKYE